ncbi:MAG TPA: bifunctional DNA-formamidopyrimidine glycosylase/DNA-(apurinic or apyrimidinic site) lyase [Candidatus Acidoferrales bacterium]|nr:bifunctional DNA-formamidopyrimidine glycosylase/DNA-(apurinic or apyrimidinic site) lyase [Candidatus Acidoferrales bacterium]
MPELPEVETVVRGLRPRVEGRRVERLEVRQPLVIRGSLTGFRRALSGARIQRVRRHGKYILLELLSPSNHTRPKVWVVHLGMTGQFYVCRPEAERLPHTHVVVRLSSGEQLRYRDPRRFGKMLLVAETDLADYFAPLGPEPLQVSFPKFCRLFTARRAPVKNLLLNQNRLRGLGNIYAIEALFVARIHPARAAGSLERMELRRLYQAMRGVLRRAIAEQGTTVADYRTAEGAPGDYQNFLRVYDREGKPCPRCDATIERIVQAGRSTHFCPRCQPWRE